MFPTGYARCAGFHFVRDRFAAPLLLGEIVARSQNSIPLKRRSNDKGQTQHSGYSRSFSPRSLSRVTNSTLAVELHLAPSVTPAATVAR